VLRWYLCMLCYLSLILKWLFDTLNDLKSKSYLLQSFRTFRDLQLSFRLFYHPSSFKKFKF
jgi:hypothetical protein